ncbi:MULTISPECIES: transposase [unclassified Marinobacterium]|jgi:putative transposase|uniref:REP-associated tyrosine transposase n=1 Tax=unclassified Marinobacterium TaxID=2644139 RepID=UPI00156A6077|nr:MULTISPECIES: transposase [unclassified Marinobacterium]NRP09566.1 Transposase IS200 like protein [Marinobacterium sp. xm-g-48]NRP28483.1 Transposase IS200 like protein [Marinobacterium sp. xm-d-420]NRP35349.1 Transposase IS200 like protein [Marinobacterium sp. xm-d-579]NRP37913.1 Transposase IS200 like protein [Marinobacterium sp. xm-a-121]NRP46363.1 Transposase IS200 like protein [Marinobacterium sp. xm-d-543]
MKPGTKALRKGRTSIPNQIYHLIATTKDRRPVFNDFRLARSAVYAINSQPISTLAYVVMPDHIHWLLQMGHDAIDLGKLMQSVKTSVSRKHYLRFSHGNIWQQGFYDHAIRSEEIIEDIARYIIYNPVRAGLVKTVREYSHWDAKWV